MEFIDLTEIMALVSVGIICVGIIIVAVMSPKIRKYLPAFVKYRHLLWTMVARDFKVKYRRSILGVLWSVLQPLFIMLILTFVFSHFFRVGIADFPVYYITGSFVFGFVTEATSSSLNSILNGGNLIKKVYIPKYLFPLEKCLFAFVNTLITLVAVVIVYLFQQTTWHPTFILFFIPLLYAAIFSFGLSLIISSLVVYFRDISHLYSIWTTAWFYLTPIIYPMQMMPPIGQTILQFNPTVHFVSFARSVMIDGVIPGWQDNAICIGFGIVTLAIGFLVFKKTQDRFVLYL